MERGVADSALGRLFAEAERRGEAIAFSLPAGIPLFLAGESADQIFWLRTGRLGAFSAGDAEAAHFLGLISSGEPAGEISLIAETPHGVSVIALRDSELLALKRQALFAAADADPALMSELARLMARLAHASPGIPQSSEPTAFGFVGLTAGVPTRAWAEEIAAAIRAEGYRAAVVDARARGDSPAGFGPIEAAHDYILYAAEADEPGWAGFVRRQADHLFLLAAAGRPPPAIPAPSDRWRPEKSFDLILVHEPTRKAPSGGGRWRSALHPGRIFNVRTQSAADVGRLARVVMGRAVGLVLSGGAARAFAHIGALRVLARHRVPLDFVAGSSLGAIIAAGLAMGWELPELEERLRKAFVRSSPVADIALPLIALSRGGRMRRRLAEHFGSRDISDMWSPFFCVSSNLTTGAPKLHLEGSVREALTASAALPGVLPPVVRGEDILVDGAIINNFPADLMRARMSGPIVGIDVTGGRSLDARDVAPASLWGWILAGDWRKGPPIVSLLMRAATMSSARDLAASRKACDLLIQPQVDDIEIRDWKAYDRAAAAGEEAANQAFQALAGEVSDIHRRPSRFAPEASAPQTARSSPESGASAAVEAL